MRVAISLLIVLSSFSQTVGAQTQCDYQQKELRKYALAAKYEQLPDAQRSNFMAQLPPAEQVGLMGLISGHNLGAGISNAAGSGYRSTITDVFNQKAEEFKRSCGFMLR